MLKKTSRNTLAIWLSEFLDELAGVDELEAKPPLEESQAEAAFIMEVGLIRMSIIGRQTSFGGELLLHKVTLDIRSNASEVNILAEVQDMKFNLLEKQHRGEVRVPILKRMTVQGDSLIRLTVTKSLTGNSEIFLKIEAVMRPIEFIFLGGECKRLLNHIFGLKKFRASDGL